ncbi:MAG: DUF2817 domain-containing protein [Ignavibacteriae bacterium]|nr:DUF2817 domain-containing protein [Ignavibacteriota bacterium]
MKLHIGIIFLIASTIIFSQEILTPLEKAKFEKFTSYSELVDFIREVDNSSDLVEAKIIGQSVEKRDLYCLFFSKDKFGVDKSKLKVMFFAQQHGNEQSGKEGSLLLIKELLKPENNFLFERIDLALIPQVNPDGSEQNKRRNGNNADLNRNHLILTEPETFALHNLFNEYLFDATLDVHEYYPFVEAGDDFGYRRNIDEQYGSNTNINISKEIRYMSNNSFIPFIKNYLNERNFSFNIYSPGGPPEKDYIRYSTFDINDGRQSFGIQNTFSFILEGINGIDYTVSNIQRRSEGQMQGMLGLLKYLYNNNSQVIELVKNERLKLLNPKEDEKIAIQLDHFNNGSKLELHLLSLKTNTDTTFYVNNFKPEVRSIYEIEKPQGYLIHKDSVELVAWLNRHKITHKIYEIMNDDLIEEYLIQDIDSIDFEGDIIVNPIVDGGFISRKIVQENYYFIPTNQLLGNLIVTALEPKSMLGLVTYKKFEHLLKRKNTFPILRVIRKTKNNCTNLNHNE